VLPLLFDPLANRNSGLPFQSGEISSKLQIKVKPLSRLWDNCSDQDHQARRRRRPIRITSPAERPVRHGRSSSAWLAPADPP